MDERGRDGGHCLSLPPSSLSVSQRESIRSDAPSLSPLSPCMFVRPKGEPILGAEGMVGFRKGGDIKGALKQREKETSADVAFISSTTLALYQGGKFFITAE